MPVSLQYFSSTMSPFGVAHCFLLNILSLVIVTCQRLSVYGDVPGLAPSPHYQIEVREKGADKWLKPFTHLTECTAETFCNFTGHFEFLHDWSNSYINIEMKEGVEVEFKITKLDGNSITKAVVHPKASATECNVKDDKAFVTINKPTLFTVDINGQMDDQDTGRLPHNQGTYDGPPIHTLTIFANPFISKPDLTDPGVYQLPPGQVAPSEGPWHTLHFLPGIHDIGMEFRVHSNKSYYIPGDALVYGTLTNWEPHGGNNVRIYGHGTLSGDRLPHPKSTESPESEYWKFRPVCLSGKLDSLVFSCK